jgi:DNA-binding GntR family transcriptional regulator
VPRTALAAKRHVEAPPGRSLSEEAYRTLKWKILSTELAPGSFLNELELASSTGFGRSPIHQALHRLQHDGLVEIRPRKGVLVRTWSPQHIRDLIETRVPIEVTAVGLAAERATDAEIKSLQVLLATGPRMIAKSDRDGLLRLDQEFHRLLVTASRNPVLAEVAKSLHQRSTLLWFVPISDKQEYEVVQAQHESILKAIRARDPAAAAAAMRAHLIGFINL